MVKKCQLINALQKLIITIMIVYFHVELMNEITPLHGLQFFLIN